MHHSLCLPGSRYRRPLCVTPIPSHAQAIVLVVIVLLAVTVVTATLAPTVAAGTAALVQAGAALWIALRRPSASTAES